MISIELAFYFMKKMAFHKELFNEYLKYKEMKEKAPNSGTGKTYNPLKEMGKDEFTKETAQPFVMTITNKTNKDIENFILFDNTIPDGIEIKYDIQGFTYQQFCDFIKVKPQQIEIIKIKTNDSFNIKLPLIKISGINYMMEKERLSPFGTIEQKKDQKAFDVNFKLNFYTRLIFPLILAKQSLTVYFFPEISHIDRIADSLRRQNAEKEQTKKSTAKILQYKYDDNSSYKAVRVYLKKDLDQAQKDLDLMKEHGSDCKVWSLVDVEIYNN